MELLNLGFAILIIKLALSVLPGVLGVYLLAMNEEKKRNVRRSLCSSVFGVSNAISYSKFSTIVLVLAFFLLAVSAVLSWFLLISPSFE